MTQRTGMGEKRFVGRWQSLLTGSGHVVVFVLVPALALAFFGPPLWGSVKPAGEFSTSAAHQALPPILIGDWASLARPVKIRDDVAASPGRTLAEEVKVLLSNWTFKGSEHRVVFFR